MTPLEAALAAVDVALAAKEYPNKLVLRAKVRAMLRAYDYVWGEQNRGFRINGVEQHLSGPLFNLKTNEQTGYKIAGKLDISLTEYSGRKRDMIMDHKYLSQSFDNDDIEQLMIAGQPLTYAGLGYAHGIRFHGATWDVIVKPTHIPGKERSRISKAGKPERAHKGTGKILPAVKEEREVVSAESMQEFEDRICGIMCDDKDRFFARPEVPMHAHNIEEHWSQLFEWTKQMHFDSKKEKKRRNPDACMMYNHPCTYLGLCSGRSHVKDGTWTTTSNIHAELELDPGQNPFKIITNSRMATYRACPLKHHLRYEVGLVKIGKEDPDSIHVGSVGHYGQEAYWREIQSTQ